MDFVAMMSYIWPVMLAILNVIILLIVIGGLIMTVAFLLFAIAYIIGYGFYLAKKKISKGEVKNES